jgi:hypothetical protein
MLLTLIGHVHQATATIAPLDLAQQNIFDLNKYVSGKCASDFCGPQKRSPMYSRTLLVVIYDLSDPFKTPAKDWSLSLAPQKARPGLPRGPISEGHWDTKININSKQQQKDHEESAPEKL